MREIRLVDQDEILTALRENTTDFSKKTLGDLETTTYQWNDIGVIWKRFCLGNKAMAFWSINRELLIESAKKSDSKYKKEYIKEIQDNYPKQIKKVLSLINRSTGDVFSAYFFRKNKRQSFPVTKKCLVKKRRTAVPFWKHFPCLKMS